MFLNPSTLGLLARRASEYERDGRRAAPDRLLRVRLLLLRLPGAHSAGAAVPRRQDAVRKKGAACGGAGANPRDRAPRRTSAPGYAVDAIMFNVVWRCCRWSPSPSTPSARGARWCSRVATAVLRADRAPAVPRWPASRRTVRRLVGDGHRPALRPDAARRPAAVDGGARRLHRRGDGQVPVRRPGLQRLQPGAGRRARSCRRRSRWR